MESATASAAHLGGVSLLRLQSDERLAQLASAGSDEAFEALVRRYRRPLLRSARRVLSEDRAEDAVQQALIDSHQALRRNGPPDRFRPWLHRIVLNSALKQAREEADTVPLVDEPNGQESTEETHERRERLRGAVGAINALPFRQRRALVARELEGRSHAEIARELGLSGGAVRQLIHRARNSVRSGASALFPPAFLLRLLGAGGPPPPVADVAAGGGAGAVATKLAIATVVAGGVAGGVALERSAVDRSQQSPAEARESTGGGDRSPASDGGPMLAADSSESRGAGHSGPGGGGRDGDGGGGSSGHGSGSGGDRSGSGSSGSGSSGSGSDDDFEPEEEIEVEEVADSSGSGSSGSGSSGSSDSGSSGGDTLSSGSSGSGSGSSGSGSGELDD